MRRWLLAVLPYCALIAQTPSSVVDIGSRRELFADRYLIGEMRGAELRQQTPLDRGMVMPVDKPWEGPFAAYFTVLHDAGRFQLYYRCAPGAGPDGHPAEATCYAESRDGIHWTKPDLGLFEVKGTRANNIVLANAAPLSHNFAPFLDTRPGVSADARYKALAGTARSGLVGFTSPDGIHWKRVREQPMLPPSKLTIYDSQNVAFWSAAEQRYLCYFRTYKKVQGKGNVRWVSRATSKDFENWDEPVEMDFGAAPAEHLYTNQTSAYFRAPHLLVAIAARFMPGRQVLTAEEAAAIRVNPNYFKDCSDVVMFTSRGGARYDRTFLESFVRPGLGLENWVSRTNYPAWNVVQTGPDEMSFYVNRNYGQPTAYLARYSLRLDGFASLHAGYAGGEMTTRPLRFTGRAMELNYATSAAGSVRVEILSDDGTVASEEIIGDQTARLVRWKPGADLAALSGKTVRLRFVLKDADVFSFRFVQ